MGPLVIVSAAASLALVVLGLAFLVVTWRVLAGPTLADRVLALDMLVAIAIGFIAVIAVKTGFTLYVDIAISLGLVGFLATVAFARFILSRGTPAPGAGEGALAGADVASGKAAKAGKGGKKKQSGKQARGRGEK